MIFISMVNTGSDGQFEFQYNYEDMLPEESEAQAGVLYTVEDTVGKSIDRRLWVFFLNFINT